MAEARARRIYGPQGLDELSRPPYLVVSGRFSLLAFVGRFLAPTLLGNILGGVSLVAAVAHAQFNPGESGATIASS
ncbi:MAG TPA: hypothetical protein VG871_08200 [Vicinamibacterales bacterium]|nr:hypothetical protein [Vicinamibacterales bacterium]